MRPLPRPVATALLLLACWPVWLFGGIVLAWAGLDELDPLGRVCLVFLFLSLADKAILRAARHAPI